MKGIYGRDKLISLLTPAILLALWEGAAQLGWIDTRFFSSPSSIFQQLWELAQSGELWADTSISMERLFWGFLLGGIPGVAPGRVVIIGGGIVGYNAAVIALGLGAQVTILERSVDRMRHLEEILSGRVSLVMSSSLQIEESITEADVVIGAVLIPGARAPKLITREMVSEMKPGSVLADVAIDQGGCAETSRPTTHSDPVYVVDGVTHYCVANMPGAVPITSTKALTNVTLPYVEAIADDGLREAVARDRALARGVNVLEGKVTYEAVAEAHNLDYSPLDDVLPLAPV
jgi:alanine dehydrogenase